MRKERQYYANKIEKEQSKLAKERSGQIAVIDHLHEQWKDKIAATKLKIEETKAKEIAKWMKKIKKKEEKIAVCISQNEKRLVLPCFYFLQPIQTHIGQPFSTIIHL